MKFSKRSTVKSLVVMAVILAVGLLAREGVNAAPPPAQLSYQGLVKVSGVPFNGTGYFTFALVDAATGDGNTLWTTGEEALPVSNGLFTFLLGSTTPLPSSLFASDPIYLRVKFSQTTGGPYQALEPNQRIVSAAYALRAEDAANLGGSPASDYLKATSALDASNLASGTVPLARLPGIPWTQLTGVPSGFADGVDNDTTYSAGTNLTLSGTTFALANSVSLSGHLTVGGATSMVGPVSTGSYVKVGASSGGESCDSSKVGAIQWNSTTSSLEVCNGSMWQVLSTDAGGGTTYTLTVSKAGTGSGTVASNPSGIYCGVVCSTSFNSSASVTLTATPDANSSFAGWTGACSGTGTCTVTMSAARAVTATFTRVPSVRTMLGSIDVPVAFDQTATDWTRVHPKTYVSFDWSSYPALSGEQRYMRLCASYSDSGDSGSFVNFRLRQSAAPATVHYSTSLATTSSGSSIHAHRCGAWVAVGSAICGFFFSDACVIEVDHPQDRNVYIGRLSIELSSQ